MPNHARAAAIALLLLTTSLAGCIGGQDEATPTNTEDAGPAGTGPPGGPGSQEGSGLEGNVSAVPGTGGLVELSSCTEHLGLFALPAELFAGQLPDGFEPEPVEGAPGTVGFFVIAVTCDTGAVVNPSSPGQPGANTSISEPGMIAGGITVRPPSELASGADVHGLLIGLLTEGEGLAQALGPWGLEPEEATISQNTADLDLASLGQAQGSVGEFQVVLATEVSAAVDDASGYHARIFSLEGYGVTGWMDVRTGGATGGGSGTATFAFPEVPPVHQGLGLQRLGDAYGYELLYTPYNVTAGAS